MAEQNDIITQSALADIKFDLQQVAENLSEHVNDSLSKAHAINLVEGFTDSDGNDRTTYQNSAGQIVGTRQLRFNVDGAVYYAPCNPSADAGQDTTTGQLTTGMTEAEFAAVGKAAWVTDFVNEGAANAEDINTVYLLPHTLRKHEEVHGNFSVTAETTLDSTGNTVGRHKVRMVIGGIRYAIPADVRLGGPPQVIRNIVASPNSQFTESSTLPLPSRNYTFSVGGGTQPYTFLWQVNENRDGSSPTWRDLDGAGGTGAILLASNFGFNYSNADTATVTIQVTSLDGIDNQTLSPAFTFRVAVTNEAGTAYSNNVYLNARDNTGSWVIYATHDVAPFTKKEMLRLYKLRLWSRRNEPEDTELYMGWWGNQLVARMKAGNYDFRVLRPRILPILDERSCVDRFKSFRELVVELFDIHWPDCPYERVQAALNELHAVKGDTDALRR